MSHNNDQNKEVKTVIDLTEEEVKETQPEKLTGSKRSRLDDSDLPPEKKRKVLVLVPVDEDNKRYHNNLMDYNTIAVPKMPEDEKHRNLIEKINKIVNKTQNHKFRQGPGLEDHPGPMRIEFGPELEITPDEDKFLQDWSEGCKDFIASIHPYYYVCEPNLKYGVSRISGWTRAHARFSVDGFRNFVHAMALCNQDTKKRIVGAQNAAKYHPCERIKNFAEFAERLQKLDMYEVLRVVNLYWMISARLLHQDMGRLEPHKRHFRGLK